jgi:hypothetical protein
MYQSLVHERRMNSFKNKKKEHMSMSLNHSTRQDGTGGGPSGRLMIQIKYSANHTSQSCHVQSSIPVGSHSLSPNATTGATTLINSSPMTAVTRIFRLLICITISVKVDIIFKYFGSKNTIWCSGTYQRRKNYYSSSWGDSRI